MSKRSQPTGGWRRRGIRPGSPATRCALRASGCRRDVRRRWSNSARMSRASMPMPMWSGSFAWQRPPAPIWRVGLADRSTARSMTRCSIACRGRTSMGRWHRSTQPARSRWRRRTRISRSRKPACGSRAPIASLTSMSGLRSAAWKRPTTWRRCSACRSRSRCSTMVAPRLRRRPRSGPRRMRSAA